MPPTEEPIPHPSAVQKPRFSRVHIDRLLERTLALTEDNDPMLYRKLKRSRPKLWQILAVREQFHATMEETDAALRKGSVRH